MPHDFTPSQPEKEQVALALPDAQLEIKNFTDYAFRSHFLIPSDGWTFTVGAERLSDEEKDALQPGAKVRLTVNGGVQATGYIDSIEVNADRGSGSQWHISGRDVLAQAVDANADPTQSLKEGSTLEAAMVTIFTPFGWSAEDQFIISNDANRDVKTADYRQKTKRSDARGFSRRALKEYKLHQLRPYPREGVYDYATRLSQRFGLWIWATASGDQLVVSQPNFDTDPFYTLFRNRDGSTNVLEGTVKFDLADQPTHIIADSYSAGGEFGKGRVKVVYVNTTVELSPEATKQAEALVKKYTDAGAIILDSPTFPASSVMRAPRLRVLYLHDDESQDLSQLSAFVRREMSLLQRKSLTCHFTVEGHGQNTPDGFVPWTVDTTVRVTDQLSGLNEVMYVIGRTFNKSRHGGTTTQLELIRLHTMVFTDDSTKSH